MDKFPAITPGELLKEEFLEPLGVSPVPAGEGDERTRAAHRANRCWATDASPTPICGFAGSSGLSDGYWLRAQEAYDLEVAREKIAPVLKRIKPWSVLHACDGLGWKTLQMQSCNRCDAAKSPSK